ncbi:MAG: Rrf2 family transcriptional regulator [Clostridiales bacterium]|nr:Rrf2 family transcriptional regulator [Clostridiales bacterium]
MKISTKGRYALRTMIDLAEQERLPDAAPYIPLKEIAQRQGIEVKYLEQIVSLLKKDGLIQGVRGSNGGYRLVRPPKDYTVREILEVTEGSLAPIACLDTPVNLCPRKDACKTLAFWEAFAGHIHTFLEGWTLQDFLDSPDKIENGSEFL